MADKVTKKYFDELTKGKTLDWQSFNGWQFVDLPSADGSVVYRFSRKSESDSFLTVRELKVRTDIKLA